MIPNYTEKEFQKAKSRDDLKLVCKKCGSIFSKKKNQIQRILKNPNSKKNSGNFCSQKCQRHYFDPPTKAKCTECGKTFTRRKSSIKNKNFCCQSCSASYNNRHKKHGTRRSKLEVWLESQLKEKYTNLEILYNKSDAINSELDIYIPTLSLAFELNGIFHYEPIFGSKKLASIQNNDARKFQACLEKMIELCIVDVSQMKYFKESNAKKFFDIICSIIDQKLLDS